MSSADPTETGTRVLAALAEGRKRLADEERKRIEATAGAIARAAADDAARGRPERGRASRVARALRGLVARRTVAKYLARLSGRASSSAHPSLSSTEDAA